MVIARADTLRTLYSIHRAYPPITTNSDISRVIQASTTSTPPPHKTATTPSTATTTFRLAHTAGTPPPASPGSPRYSHTLVDTLQHIIINIITSSSDDEKSGEWCTAHFPFTGPSPSERRNTTALIERDCGQTPGTCADESLSANADCTGVAG